MGLSVGNFSPPAGTAIRTNIRIRVIDREVDKKCTRRLNEFCD
jgi:hypothetical protein